MAGAPATVPQPPQREGLLAIDAGQSSIRLRFRSEGQTHTGRRPGLNTGRPLTPQLASAITSFANEVGAEVRAVGVGASGLDRPDANELLWLLEPSVVEVTLAHDATAWYLGTLGDRPGVVIAAGTGVVTLAMGATEVARVDGWGYLMGDAGSAYWIGRNALEAAMRGYDGRRQITELTDEIAKDFADLELAYLELQADENRVARIAGYAALVDRLASTDPVAENILDKAAAHLSEAVFAGLRRVGLAGSEPHVCAVGQVFRSQRVLHQFTEFLTLQWPNFALTEPQGDALDGAAALLVLSEGSPMYSRVSRARR